MKRQATLLKWHAYYDGWPLTMLRLAIKWTELIGLSGTRSEWFQRLSERQFDRRFGVLTRGVVSTEELDYPADRKLHAVEYLPTRASSVGWLFSNLPVDLSEFMFVDCGSGKGRVLLVASEFPFKKVMGVELAHQLHEIASENIKKFRSRRRQCANVESVNMDATEFEFSTSPLILFLYNPFSEELTRMVIDNLTSSLKKASRPIVVIYHNPVYTKVFEENSAFQENYWNCRPGHGWKIYTATSEINNLTA